MIYFDVAHMMFTSLYTIDLIIRISSELKSYFHNLYNVLDVAVVILYYTHWILRMLYPYHEIYVGLRMVQGLRIFRMFRLIPQFKSLESVVNALFYTLRTSVLDVIILSMMIIFTLSIVGNALFGREDNGPAFANWFSLPQAFLSLWVHFPLT
jgi:cation channel sperm-associated protein 3